MAWIDDAIVVSVENLAYLEHAKVVVGNVLHVSIALQPNDNTLNLIVVTSSRAGR